MTSELKISLDDISRWQKEAEKEVQDYQTKISDIWKKLLSEYDLETIQELFKPQNTPKILLPWEIHDKNVWRCDLTSTIRAIICPLSPQESDKYFIQLFLDQNPRTVKKVFFKVSSAQKYCDRLLKRLGFEFRD